MNQDPRYQKFDIGDWSYGSPEILSWDNSTKLSIGKYCSFASGITLLLGGEHRSDWVSTYPFNAFFKEWSGIEGHPASKGNLTIGNDVWIGYGATILSGIHIGDGAIIGAKAVVTKDIPSYAIVAGNPAKTIKYRFPPELIEELLDIRWWELPHEQVLGLVPLLLSDNISTLAERVRNLKHKALDL